MQVEECNQYGVDLERIMKLRTYPIALKWYENIEDIPEGTIFPKRDLNKHLSYCQAKGITRTKGWSIAMTIEDHWCWNPLIGFGCVECEPETPAFDEVVKFIGIPDKEKAEKFFAEFPRLPYKKYKAAVTSPLSKAKFVPDIVLVYGNTDQVNYLLRMVKTIRGERLAVEFDGIDSCVYSTVTPYLKDEYQVTFPDPGDRERAHSRDDEVIFTIPVSKLDEIMQLIRRFDSSGMGYNYAHLEFAYDHGRPPFYNSLFKMWGLEQGEEWIISPEKRKH